MRELKGLLVFAIAASVVGCMACPHANQAGESWRQVYATAPEETSHTLLLWDFTDPARPLVREFSFQAGTYRKWVEYELPPKPGTTWSKESDGKR